MRSIVATVIMVLTMLNSNALALDTASTGPPYAESQVLTEQRFGITYTDPYRWMENSDDAALYVWLRDQETYTKHKRRGRCVTN